MMKNFRKHGVMSIVLAGAMLASTGCVTQAPMTPVGIEQKIANAISRLDHEDIASQYERQAQVDATAAVRHQGYAAGYRKNRSLKTGLPMHASLANHCEVLARTYQQAADENLVLAKLHRDLAAEASP